MCTPRVATASRETYSEHFVTEESIAILVDAAQPGLHRLPFLRVMISHGGGSVPYQIGRWQAEALHPALGGDPEAERFETSLRRFWFDSVLHHPPSLELLLRTVGADRVLFGTEKPGSGSAPNPDTGRDFDDLKPVIEGFGFLSGTDRRAVFEDNARLLFPALKNRGGSPMNELVKRLRSLDTCAVSDALDRHGLPASSVG